jgi:hypothetical protein
MAEIPHTQKTLREAHFWVELPKGPKPARKQGHAVTLATPRWLSQWCKVVSVVCYRFAINFWGEPFLSSASIPTL